MAFQYAHSGLPPSHAEGQTSVAHELWQTQDVLNVHHEETHRLGPGRPQICSIRMETVAVQRDGEVIFSPAAVVARSHHWYQGFEQSPNAAT